MPSAESARRVGGSTGLRYHRLHRIGRAKWHWAVIGLLLLAVTGYLGIQLVGITVFLATSALGGSVSTDPINPAGLAGINLVWAIAIPITFLVSLIAHRLRPGWVSSVAGRIRWRWLITSFGLAFLALIATLVVAMLVPAGAGSEVGGTVNDATRRTVDFVLVIALLTPLQAAGEEYVFRGYLTQIFGGFFAGPVGTALSVVLPAVLFALAHGAQDPPVFVDRLAFGLVAGAVVVLTGGLESAIAMHVLNNWFAFGLALAFGDLNSSLHPTSSTWWTLPSTLTQSLVFLALTVWAARRTGLTSRTGRAVLEGPQRPV